MNTASVNCFIATGRVVRQALVLALYCLVVAPVYAAGDASRDVVEQRKLVIVRTQTDWQAVLSSGATTPLDALTPYGKRRFVSTLQWGQRGLGGFEVTSLIRELNAEQLSAVLTFFDSASYLPSLKEELVGTPLRLPAPSPDIERDVLDLEKFELLESRKPRDFSSASTALGSARVLQRYIQLFGERMKRGALQREALGNLALLFDAAARTSDQNPGSSALDDMLHIHQELATRGVDTRRSFDDAVLTALIAARSFEQARTFVHARPHLASKKVPHVVDRVGPGYQGRTLLQYDFANNKLTRVAAPHIAGIELIMVVDGGCHFSQDALAAIRNDADMQARLSKVHLTLVTPPRAAMNTRFLADWNAKNVSMQISVPYSLHEWQAFDVVGVPEFFVLKNGVLSGRLDLGWPAGGNKAALFQLIDSASDRAQ